MTSTKTKNKTNPTPANPCPPPKVSPCSCGCHGSGSACTCCETPCFERPNYFCGQLLTDADLSAEQSYLREKNKLYHRALHGHGIVCGLRLTCAKNCCNEVQIGDGYAIDDCGNDIVVCESATFDVVAALKEKDWLGSEAPCDPCEERKTPPCKVKQCFYIVICYDEQPTEFTTPFKTTCGSGSSAACEPTRIRETYRFDVLKHPPKQCNYLDDLEDRITACWSVFTEGPFAQKMKEFFECELCGNSDESKNTGDQADNPGKKDRENRDHCKTFCQLKVLFQHHLKRYPALYDCTFWDKVCQLECRSDDPCNFDSCRDAFCKLFELIQQYTYEYILGEMIFQCPRPPKAHCVGLGTVEIEDGKLLRVCNCPRSYVWAFANLIEIAIAKLGETACASHEHSTPIKPGYQTSDEDRRKSPCTHDKKCKCGCCADFDFCCRQFIDLFCRRPDFGNLAAIAPIKAVRDLIESLKTGFNFTDALKFSPDIFQNMTEDEAKSLVRSITGSTDSLQFVRDSMHSEIDMFTAVRSHTLIQPGDPILAHLTDQKKISRITPGLDSSILVSRLQAAETLANSHETKLMDMAKEITTLREQLATATKGKGKGGSSSAGDSDKPDTNK